jgi:hypothetical protein
LANYETDDGLGNVGGDTPRLVTVSTWTMSASALLSRHNRVFKSSVRLLHRGDQHKGRHNQDSNAAMKKLSR